MKFISNIYNPYLPDARMHFIPSYEEFYNPKLTEWEWQQHLKWVNENIIGDPQATEKYSVEELKAMNMVGLYSKEITETL